MKYAEELNSITLAHLAAGSLDAIWIRSFRSPQQCQAVLPRVVEACERSHYTLTKDFQSIGTSIGEAAESAAGERRYLETAAKTLHLIRNEIFAERLSPLDELRLRLDELWPDGATVGHHKGRMMLPGIIRRWPTGGHANPHIDQRTIPLLAAQRLQRRIGTNIYLDVPLANSGGQVDFWALWTDEGEYDARRRTDYGLDRDKLGEPHWSCAPGQGDLLMFDAARVHGVRRVEGGSRVTAACFVGVRGSGEPLVLFA